MIALLWLVGCSPAEPELTVLAASSLTEAFEALEPAYEGAHPGVDLRLAFAGSQTLATQIRHGVQADVFASANEEEVGRLAADSLVGEAAAFAWNELVIAVPADREEAVELEELGSVERLVIGGEAVPVGRYTDALFDAAEARYGSDWRAAVDRAVVSREPSVRSTLAKLTLGEADAAVVYATDAAAVSGVRAVALPDGLGVRASYHQAPIRSGRAEPAASWMAFVTGPQGRAVLVEHGFAVAP